MKKPIILCILDGFGYRKETRGNAVYEAKKPNLTAFFEKYPTTLIEASGMAVGLPKGQMGNSEVGHLNLGAGRVVYQSLTLLNKAVEDGDFYKNPHYLHAIEHVKKHHSKLHVMGLLSDGGVHSHIDHIVAMLRLAKEQGLDQVYVHCFMDGRDVDPQSGVHYLDTLQHAMDELKVGQIADISGRYYAMDRDKNLDRNDIAYRVMVDYDGPSFKDYHDFLKEQYTYLPTTGKEASDEFILPHYHEGVEGQIQDDDAVIFMNFRPDRAIQIGTMITNPHYYEHPPVNEQGNPVYKAYVPGHILKNIFFVSTMKYADSVLGEIAFALPSLKNVLGVWLADHGYRQLRIAETEKYAHVTFFFDGTVNYDGVTQPALKNCRRILVNSPKVATYDLKPEMSAYEVTDRLLEALNEHNLDVVILNFANCDMVGHTAVENAVIKAVEDIDTCCGRLIKWAEDNDAVLMITADHGNAEMVIDDEGKPYTAHTTNPVPYSINIPGAVLRKDGKLSNIAPTIISLLGEKVPEEMTEPSMILEVK